MDREVIDGLASPGGLTVKSVAELDKDNALWAYFANAAQQPIVPNTQEYYVVSKPTDAPASMEFRRSGFGYRTKKMVQATDSYNPGAGTRPRAVS